MCRIPCPGFLTSRVFKATRPCCWLSRGSQWGSSYPHRLPGKTPQILRWTRTVYPGAAPAMKHFHRKNLKTKALGLPSQGGSLQLLHGLQLVAGGPGALFWGKEGTMQKRKKRTSGLVIELIASASDRLARGQQAGGSEWGPLGRMQLCWKGQRGSEVKPATRPIASLPRTRHARQECPGPAVLAPALVRFRQPEHPARESPAGPGSRVVRGSDVRGFPGSSGARVQPQSPHLWNERQLLILPLIFRK